MLGKVKARTDWNGVVKDIGNLNPAEQQAAISEELGQDRQYPGGQALKQNALDGLLGKSVTGKSVRGLVAEEAIGRIF
jgi:hypothetical protein